MKSRADVTPVQKVGKFIQNLRVLGGSEWSKRLRSGRGPARNCMNRSNTSAIVLGLLLFSAALAAAVAFRQPAIAATNCSTSSAGVDSAEQQVVSLINDARAAIGVAPLAISTNLSRAAAWKSEDPSASPPLSHTDSLGRSPTQRSRDCGYNGGVGENIAWGFPSAEAVFNGWMGSSGHRSNLLSSNYAVIGVGRSGTAWTTDFGLVADGGSPPPPTATPTIPVSTATEPPSAIPSLTPPVGTATSSATNAGCAGPKRHRNLHPPGCGVQSRDVRRAEPTRSQRVLRHQGRTLGLRLGSRPEALVPFLSVGSGVPQHPRLRRTRTCIHDLGRAVTILGLLAKS